MTATRTFHLAAAFLFLGATGLGCLDEPLADALGPVGKTTLDTTDPSHLAGSYRSENETIVFESKATADGLGARATFSIDGVTILTSVIAGEVGTITLGGHRINTGETLDGARQTALTELQDKYGVGLAQIPLTAGCLPFDPTALMTTGALLLPWQLIIAGTSMTVDEIHQQFDASNCEEHYSAEAASKDPTGRIGYSRRKPGIVGVPFVLTGWLSEQEAIAPYAADDCTLYTNCSSDTGYDNPCYGCCGYGCVSSNGSSCVSARVCEEHDGCYQQNGGRSPACDAVCVGQCGVAFCAGLAAGICNSLDWLCGSQCDEEEHDTDEETGGRWCEGTACGDEGDACTQNGQCASGVCSDDTCQPPGGGTPGYNHPVPAYDCWMCTPGAHTSLAHWLVNLWRALDPNDKIGPDGTGADKTVARGSEVLPYMVRFENNEEAGANVAAQEIVIVDYLDASLDYNTVVLGDINFGGRIISVPTGVTSFTLTDVPTNDGCVITGAAQEALAVEISFDFNSQNGRIEMRLKVIDTATDDFPNDPFAGILPPDQAEVCANGHMTFTAQLKPDAAIGELVTNKASIVFDYNPAIETNEVWNTIGQ